MTASSPLRAIRLKCLDCSNQQIKEVRLCPVIDCPLYGYRMGHKPKNTQVNEGFSDEEIEDEEIIAEEYEDEKQPGI